MFTLSYLAKFHRKYELPRGSKLHYLKLKQHYACYVKIHPANRKLFEFFFAYIEVNPYKYTFMVRSNKGQYGFKWELFKKAFLK